MKVYISGPIAGRPDKNLEAFLVARDALQARGYDTLLPHHIPAWTGHCFGKPTTHPDDIHGYGCYLLGDLQQLPFVDAILTLPDWQESPGARAEVAFAEACGIPVWHVIP